MTEAQKAKMQAGRKAAKAAAGTTTPGSSSAVMVIKPAKVASTPTFKGYIPRGTPIAAIASTVEEILKLAKAGGKPDVTRVAGTLRFY